MLLTTLLVTLSMVVTTANPADASMRQQRRAHQIQHGLRVAIDQIGDPYVYGADGPGAFDCSGLVMFSYKRAGVYLPRSSSAQAHYVRHIPKSHLHRGDLMFFYDGGGVYHVGIFLRRDHGRPILLHAPYPGRRVHREHVWTHRWFAGTLRLR
jgi:cell wall-associated NlpC family hydrolase